MLVFLDNGRRATISLLKECPDCAPVVKMHILGPVLALSVSSLLQDLALDSLLAFLEQIIRSEAVEYSDLLAMFRKREEEALGKHATYNLARCIAVITASTSAENRQAVVDETLALLEKVETPEDAKELRRVTLALLVSGDLGSLEADVADKLQNIYAEYFLSPSEDLKHAAAYALGRASVGNQSVFLPVIVNSLGEKNQKKQYLLLSALREYIKCSFRESGGDEVATSLPLILPHLEQHCKEAEEGTRAMVAECLGSLTCMQPDTMLKKLVEMQDAHSKISAPGGVLDPEDAKSKENALVCWTVATSLKLAIAGKLKPPELAPYMPGFLKLLQEEELSVRNAALLMTVSVFFYSLFSSPCSGN